MAHKPQSRCRWLPVASKIALIGASLSPQLALADDGAINGRNVQQAANPALLAVASTPLPVTPSVKATGVTLILSVSVNRVEHGLAQFQMIDGRLWASPATLRDLGLRLDGDMTVAESSPQDQNLLSLNEAFGTETLRYDPAMQTLAIMVPSGKLAVGTSQLNPVRQDRAVVASSTGALLNYDVYLNRADGQFSVNGYTEARVFSGTAMMENTALVNAWEQEGSGWSSQVIRMDTSFTYSLPDKRLSLRAGDTLTRSTSWSRPTRIGGLRFGTDFALQPYLITAPIPAFYGDATLPSTVDLYINGVKQYSGDVSPGPFEVGSGLTRVNGAGAAQLVVTDALGQVTTLNFPFYETPALLRKGLTDWSVEIGKVRENYGITSFDYAKQIVASASARTGISDRFTIEAHGEASSSLVNAGVGGTLLLPFGGTVSANLAGSHTDGQTGHREEIGLGWMNSRFNLSATVQRASKDYSDIADQYGAPVPVSRELATVGYNTGRFGAFSASYVSQRYAGEDRFSYASANWSKQLGKRFSINASANQSLTGRKETSFFLTLSFTPGDRDYMTAGVQATDDRTSASVGYRRSLPTEGGLGWAADAVVDKDRIQASAQADLLGSWGQLTAGARSIGHYQSGYVGYSGAIVAMGGDVELSRKVDDGFALVSTNGVPDVPVLVHNREVGHTRGNGKLLVTGLNPYENNKISIDTSTLPASFNVAGIEGEAVPAAGAGVGIRFDLTAVRSVLMTLVDDSGNYVPAGVRGYFGERPDRPYYVGYDGQLFIEDAIAGGTLVLTNEEKKCSVSLPAQLMPKDAGQLGKMTCKWGNE
ncbi:MAG TPA: fimbria/pilus outer membrane usher protein [Hyphomicrobiaceae bacterium]|nr:fimbria/pilus outer membrane usher protein [Hyphomicrobiaceae bacterium]